VWVLSGTSDANTALVHVLLKFPTMTRILTILLITQLLVINGCKPKVKDPTHGLIIGSNSNEWKSTIKHNINTGLFTQESDKNYFLSFIIIKDDTINASSSINRKGFFCGKLLEYRIEPETSLFYDSISITYRRVHEYNSIRKIYKAFINTYGNPSKSRPEWKSFTDSRVWLGTEPEIKYHDKHFEENNYIRDSIPAGASFISFWELPEYIIEFSVGKLYFSNDSVPYVEESYISFIHPDYERELQLQKDSLILNYTPKDYIDEIVISNCYASDLKTTENRIPYREIIFDIEKITRDYDADHRESDVFNEELFTLEDQQLDIPQPLGPSMMISLNPRNNSYSFTYYIKSPEVEKLEKQLLSTSDLKAKLNITGILFTDGTVLAN
jgi:hypothetical protein